MSTATGSGSGCSATLRAPAAAVAVGVLAATARHRSRSSVRRQAADVVVDVIDEQGLVGTILKQVEESGVPVCGRQMEYKSTLVKSPLRSCGIPELERADDPAEALRREHEALGPDRADVAAAVLALMLGGVDEAHNLVTPHSWASPTTYSGPPKHSTTMKQEASYCHAILHRMEGPCLGEFGTGFNNSAYWLGTALGSSRINTGKHPIFPALRDAAAELAVGIDDAEHLLKTMGKEWDIYKFNRSCEDAIEFDEEDMLQFCAAVQACELQLLYRHILSLQDR